MASYTYPVAHPSGTLTEAQIHAILSKNTVVAKKIATLADQKFLSDYLLSARLTAQGGGIFYESGESIFGTAPEQVAAGAEYPLTVLSPGEILAAKTVKWGRDTLITDERIAQSGQVALDRPLLRLANSVVKTVDATAWGVITTKVTNTYSSAAWSSIGAITTAILAAQAQADALGLGINLDTVALPGAAYAKVMGLFLTAGVLPRENANPILSGEVPANLLGVNWVTGSTVTGNDPWFFDREQLGGMADEKHGTGYATAGDTGAEAKSIRDDEKDAYRVRARRVTVPVVLEPQAGLKITGASL